MTHTLASSCPVLYFHPNFSPCLIFQTNATNIRIGAFVSGFLCSYFVESVATSCRPWQWEINMLADRDFSQGNSDPSSLFFIILSAPSTELSCLVTVYVRFRDMLVMPTLQIRKLTLRAVCGEKSRGCKVPESGCSTPSSLLGAHRGCEGARVGVVWPQLRCLTAGCSTHTKDEKFWGAWGLLPQKQGNTRASRVRQDALFYYLEMEL